MPPPSQPSQNMQYSGPMPPGTAPVHPQSGYYGGGTVPPGYTHPPSTPISQPVKRGGFNITIAALLIVGVLLIGVVVVGGVIAFSSGMIPGFGVSSGQPTDTIVPELIVETAVTPSEPPADVGAPTQGIAPGDTPEPLITAPPLATATITATYTPSSTPMGGGMGQIAFVSDRSGLPQIWLMDTNGENKEQLTEMGDGACQPAWSPDGAKLAFVSPCKRKTDNYDGSGIFIINADGSGMEPMTAIPGGDFNPAWSPDGTKIAYTSMRESFPHVFVLDLNDKTEIRLSNQSSRDRRPAWSPDGEWVAFETTRIGHEQVWIIRSDGGDKPFEFSVFANGFGTRPAWAPDGNIVYYSQGDALPWLATKSFDNRALPEHKVSDVRPIWEVDVSPDGYWVIFETLLELGNRDIYRMTANGGELTQLTSDGATDFEPAWRPVGSDN